MSSQGSSEAGGSSGEPHSERRQGKAGVGEAGRRGHTRKRQDTSNPGKGKGMGSPPGLPEAMQLYLDVALIGTCDLRH